MSSGAFFGLTALFLAQNALQFLGPWTPPLLLIGVIFYGLSAGTRFGFVAGCFAGLFFEMFAIGRLGASALAFGAVGAAAGRLGSAVFRDSAFSTFALPVLADYATTAAGLFFAQHSLPDAARDAFSWRQTISPAHWIATAASAPLVFGALARLHRRPLRGRRVR